MPETPLHLAPTNTPFRDTPALLTQREIRTSEKVGEFLTITYSLAGGAQIKGSIFRETRLQGGRTQANPVYAALREAEIGSGWALTGKTGQYNNTPQLEVSAVAPLPAEHPIYTDGVVKARVDVAVMSRDLDALIESLSPAYARLVGALIGPTGRYRSDFVSYPAAIGHHHNYLHGLLEHTLEVAHGALQLGQPWIAEGVVTRDQVLAGALLHDLGKLREYRLVNGIPQMSEDSMLHYHTVTGMSMVEMAHDRLLEAADGPELDRVELAHLTHTIVSHHRTREYGSPVEPRTPAAECVANADMASARLGAIAHRLARNEAPTPEALLADRYLAKTGPVLEPAVLAQQADRLEALQARPQTPQRFASLLA
jgi:putative nucleotidyltransferase with HDIG domain